MHDRVPARERGMIVGVYGGLAGLAVALGPIVGGAAAWTETPGAGDPGPVASVTSLTTAGHLAGLARARSRRVASNPAPQPDRHRGTLRNANATLIPGLVPLGGLSFPVQRVSGAGQATQMMQDSFVIFGSSDDRRGGDRRARRNRDIYDPDPADFPVATDMSERILSLPLSPKVTEVDQYELGSALPEPLS